MKPSGFSVWSVAMALGHLQDLGQLDVDRPLRERPEDAHAVLGQIEAHVDLLQQALQPREAVAFGAGDDPTRGHPRRKSSP